MQSTEAERLRKEWGDKPCDHPSVEAEYYLGTNTGDYVCTTCGEMFWGKDAWRKARAQALDNTDGQR